MQRVIRRLGFAPDDQQIDQIANEMYPNLRWEDSKFVLQYIAVGKRKKEEIQDEHPLLVQIEFKDIARFLYDRFMDFPEKLRWHPNEVHQQWPEFGQKFGEYVRVLEREQRSYNRTDVYAQSTTAITNYINSGEFPPASGRI